MYKYLKYLIITGVFLSLSSCSVKKNTGLTRGYHSLTSRYNILFNGRESYEKGMLKLQNNYQDDFSQTLPVFLYTKPDALSSIGPEMDRSITKSTKIIALHSITVKPEVKPDKQLNAKQLEFYNKKEFNKWVDEAYLLMGKSHFHKNEYDKARETFQFLNSNFAGEPTVYESRIWQARLAIEREKFKEAENILSNLQKDVDLPKKLHGDLNATYAHFYFLQERYEEAIVSLKKAIDKLSDKYYETRYTYVLAQLYMEMGDNFQASEQFRKVIKKNPPYEMTFNAKINRALTYQSGSKAGKDIEKQLRKMLRDDKNIEFQDQIFYALGNIALKKGDKQQAIEYYKESIAATAGNSNQLALSSLTLADIFYEIPDYINAQAYYDSTVAVIQPDYPNYQIIYAKSVSLTNLVEHIETVEREDSLQKLAQMPEPELLAYVDELIIKVREEEEEARKLREEQMLAMENDGLNPNSMVGPAFAGSDNWYFYNNTSIQVGRSDFKKRWGSRKLEDNWRRRNKSSISFEPEALTQAGEGEATDSAGVAVKLETNRYKPEYYLQHIPKTDSMMELSHQRIMIALFQMGDIYSSELRDYEKATIAFEELLKRYPDYENKLQAYYELYSIGRANQNKELISIYQQKIISEYPNSLYAKILTDPDFIKELEARERELEELYQKTYQAFESQRFSQVINMSNKAIDKFPESDLLPKFEYMLTVSESIGKDTLAFINNLENFISKYQGTEIAEVATTMITYLKEGHPEIAARHEEITAEALFNIGEEDEIHYFAISLPTGRNLNQLFFNILNFNLDEFPDAELNVEKEDLGSGIQLCLVDKFENADLAMDYQAKIKVYNDLWKDVEYRDSNMFIISDSNLNILRKQKDVGKYYIFYRKHYTSQ